MKKQVQHFPHIIFKNIPLNTEVDWMYGFLFNDSWGWGKYIIRKHPSLKKIYGLKEEDARIALLKKYILAFRAKNKNIIAAKKKEYRRLWKTVERPYFQLLEKILETSWPQERKTITALISLNPICPRFLNTWGFMLYFNFRKSAHALEVIMHETCHFLHFKKWLEVFPRTNTKKFNPPDIIWHLSEVTAPVVLNDPRVQKYLKHKAVFYPEHSRLYYKGVTVPAYFVSLHKKYAPKGFKSFLRIAYREAHKIHWE